MNCSFGITRKDGTKEGFDLLTIEVLKRGEHSVLFTSAITTLNLRVTVHAVHFCKREMWAIQ